MNLNEEFRRQSVRAAREVTVVVLIAAVLAVILVVALL